MDPRNFLEDLAAHVRAAVGESANVELVGREEKSAVEVTPETSGACRFSVFRQDEDEITLEFGEMSILDFHGQAVEDLQAACREAVDAIIEGKVSESVYLKGGTLVRAVAQLRLSDRTVTVRTRRGVAPFSRKGLTRDYLPYHGV
ncbi:hypothetical protein [Micromonospora rubida]|uniref:hypothetical protein n=1 Tax=Micromonospora rubida TaxID=2697657 RepID=UPI001376E8B1|nr:hypothetical protein [Micromonospora rubida]NBE82076.1 hypothetical protein [Micromonospora rubida]